MRFVAIGLVVFVAGLAAGVDTAHACSCAPPEPRSMLAQADGAFVGRLESRRELDNGRALFTFRVERSVKGRLGATVDVETASSGAGCGIEATVGARIGLFLDRERGRWTSLLCWQVDPEDLLAATQPLPAPNGRGPVALLLGSRFGPARTLALDGSGRTLAYGRGPGTVLQISLCPGGKRMAEVVQLDSGVAVAVRALPDLGLVRQRLVVSPSGAAPTALRCEALDGSRLLLFHSSADRPTGARLERVTEVRTTLLWHGTAIGATLTERTAFVPAGARGTRLVAVDLGSRRVRAIGRIPPPFGPLVADPAATQLAGVVSSAGSRRLLVNVRVDPFTVTTRRLADVGEVAWVGTRRVAFFSGDQRARLYTPTLGVASSFAWAAYRAAISGSTVYGVGFDGLHRADLPSGPERVVRRLPSRLVNVIVAVPR